MIMLTKVSNDEELIFIAPQHIVMVWTDLQDDKDNSSIVRLSTGELIHVYDDRNEIVEMIESELLAIEVEK